jgi:hypothetical protein
LLLHYQFIFTYKNKPKKRNVGKGAILGTMIGFVAELLGMLSDFLKRKA